VSLRLKHEVPIKAAEGRQKPIQKPGFQQNARVSTKCSLFAKSSCFLPKGMILHQRKRILLEALPCARVA